MIDDGKPAFTFTFLDDRVYSFEGRPIFNRKFRKFGLKCLFGPKIYVFVVLTPRCYSSKSRPQKGTSLAENML